MKKQLIIFSVAIIGIMSAYSVSQEFIKQKSKKVYVSKQQDAELDGDLVIQSANMSGVLINLSKTIWLITQSAITRVNGYACGEKDCVDKVGRTDRYEKKMKIKEALDRFIVEIEKIQQAFDNLIATLEA